MGTPLFGIDIAGLVNQHVAPGLYDCTLTLTTPGTRTPGSLAGGTNPSSATYAGKGILDDFAVSQIDGSIVLAGDKRMLVVVESFSPVLPRAPQPDDFAAIEGKSYRVKRTLSRDPASATYVLHVRGV